MSRIKLSDGTKQLLRCIVSRNITKYRSDIAQALLKLDAGATYDEVVADGTIERRDAEILQRELYGHTKVTEVLNMFKYKVKALPISASDIPTLKSIANDCELKETFKRYARVLLSINDGIELDTIAAEQNLTKGRVVNIHKTYSYYGMDRLFILMPKDSKSKYRIKEVEEGI